MVRLDGAHGGQNGASAALYGQRCAFDAACHLPLTVQGRSHAKPNGVALGQEAQDVET